MVLIDFCNNCDMKIFVLCQLVSVGKHCWYCLLPTLIKEQMLCSSEMLLVKLHTDVQATAQKWDIITFFLVLKFPQELIPWGSAFGSGDAHTLYVVHATGTLRLLREWHIHNKWVHVQRLLVSWDGPYNWWQKTLETTRPNSSHLLPLWL